MLYFHDRKVSKLSYFPLEILFSLLMIVICRVGIIKAGDRLLAVDGFNLSQATLQEALQTLKQIKQTALLTIEYDVSIIGKSYFIYCLKPLLWYFLTDQLSKRKNFSEAVKNATGPLLIEIDKTPGCLLGISLTCVSVPEHAIVIESIRQASTAERYVFVFQHPPYMLCPERYTEIQYPKLQL